MAVFVSNSRSIMQASWVQWRLNRPVHATRLSSFMWHMLCVRMCCVRLWNINMRYKNSLSIADSIYHKTKINPSRPSHVYSLVNHALNGSDNGLSPVRCHAIIGTNAGLLIIGASFQWNFNQHSTIFILENAFENVTAKWPSCLLVLQVLNAISDISLFTRAHVKC